MSQRLLLILEDSPARTARFERVFSALGFDDVQMEIHQDEMSMMSAIDAGYDRLGCVSLDHDLFPQGVEDAGDGMQVARHLAIKTPRCPFILHTSNSEQCRRMQGVLDAAGWTVRLAGAIGEDWIERDWRIEIARAIGPR